jgi:hypothetical protein
LCEQKRASLVLNCFVMFVLVCSYCFVECCLLIMSDVYWYSVTVM